MMTGVTEGTAEATQEISSSILLAASEVMTRHGNDPNGCAIVAAGFAMAIKSMGRDIDSKIPLIIAEMIAK